MAPPATFFELKQVDAETAFIEARWQDGIECPACGGSAASAMAGRGGWLCLDCKEKFTITSWSAIAATRATPYQWLCACWLVAEHGLNVSTCYLATALSVQQKTAWLMRERIIYALGHEDHEDNVA